MACGSFLFVCGRADCNEMNFQGRSTVILPGSRPAYSGRNRITVIGRRLAPQWAVEPDGLLAGIVEVQSRANGIWRNDVLLLD